jgi:hypothetical protein
MTQPATRSFAWMFASSVIVVILIVIGVQQWRLAKRVDRLEDLLGAHEADHARQRQLETQKAAGPAELRARVYFPPGTFAADPGRDRTLAESFSAPLRSMWLEPLWNPNRKPPIPIYYRLTWLAGPDSPTSVAINWGGPLLTRAKSYKLQPDAPPVGYPVPENDQPISADRVEEFDRLLAGADFWHMPTLVEGEATGAGPRSIFEGVDVGGSYHVVVRTTDGPSSYQALCRFMFEWSKPPRPTIRPPAPPRESS